MSRRPQAGDSVIGMPGIIIFGEGRGDSCRGVRRIFIIWGPQMEKIEMIK
jgi:hypothetical protein